MVNSMDSTYTQSPPKETTSEQKLKTPLEQFQESAQAEPPNQFATRLSLAPLVRKWQARQADGDEALAPTVLELMTSLEEKLAAGELSSESLQHAADFKSLVPLLFPSLFEGQGLGFIMVPMTKQFAYQSPRFISMMVSKDWELASMPSHNKQPHYHMIFSLALLILNRFYNQEIQMTFSEVFALRNRKTGLLKYYRITLILDYVEVELKKPMNDLSDEQVQELMNNLEDLELWLKYLPPANFAFSGFVPGYTSDVTQIEVLSQMRQQLAAHEKGTPDKLIQGVEIIQNYVRSFMDDPELMVGCLPWAFAIRKEEVNWSILRNSQQDFPYQHVNSYYQSLQQSGEAILYYDLKQVKNPSEMERRFAEVGARSLLITPLIDRSGEMIGVFEMASTNPGRFSKLTLMQIEELVSLFSLGVEREINKIHNQVQTVVQEKFTAIHPSVQWKFQETATQYIFDSQFGKEQATVAPIVFKDVYPLYGQADIVGSSQLRNVSIQEDLVDNLHRVEKVLNSFRKQVDFVSLDLCLTRIKGMMKELKAGPFNSRNETQIVEFLTHEVHPLIHHLVDRFSELDRQKAQKYFDYLDPQLGIVYRHRRDYEESVTHLNNTVGNYLELEDRKKQKTLPHFFEKYKTDGVEYNMYIGQSLLKSCKFDAKQDVQEFRLWQLEHMVEVTRLVDREAEKWPIALQTAQLIFVYNHPLTIRFRMDEKKFDVDGTYNVRYEILKKRIDKAVIKGTQERLTQPGKISIVWLQEKDRDEYLKYLELLVHKGLITGEIEQLELDELPGAAGLQALRVSVKL